MEKLKFELIDSEDNVVEEVMAMDLEEALDLFVYNKKGNYMVTCEGERATEISIKSEKDEDVINEEEFWEMYYNEDLD